MQLFMPLIFEFTLFIFLRISAIESQRTPEILDNNFSANKIQVYGGKFELNMALCFHSIMRVILLLLVFIFDALFFFFD